MKYALPFLAIVTTALLSGCQANNPTALQNTVPETAAASAAPLETPEVETGSAEGSDAADTLSAQALNAWPTLQQGSSGNDVKAAQYLLNAHGVSVGVDGAFGAGTAAAVKSFQSRSGLSADGVVGPNTWGKLVVTVQQGSTGNAVKAVQIYLGIAVDGEFGTGTAAAVKSFQSRSGLGTDGVVGPQTWQALVAGTSSSGGGGTTPAPGTDRAKLAQQILSSSRITLVHYNEPTSPYQTFLATAQGKQAASGCHGNGNCGARVYLDPRMLSGALRVANSYKILINSTTGSGLHVANSYHYKGRAIDISVVNGVSINASNPYYKGLMAACRSTGAVEVLGPGYAGHDTHVHCAW